MAVLKLLAPGACLGTPWSPRRLWPVASLYEIVKGACPPVLLICSALGRNGRQRLHTDRQNPMPCRYPAPAYLLLLYFYVLICNPCRFFPGPYSICSSCRSFPGLSYLSFQRFIPPADTDHAKPCFLYLPCFQAHQLFSNSSICSVSFCKKIFW